jgi:hypothetical protein
VHALTHTPRPSAQASRGERVGASLNPLLVMQSAGASMTVVSDGGGHGQEGGGGGGVRAQLRQLRPDSTAQPYTHEGQQYPARVGLWMARWNYEQRLAAAAAAAAAQDDEPPPPQPPPPRHQPQKQEEGEEEGQEAEQLPARSRLELLAEKSLAEKQRADAVAAGAGGGIQGGSAASTLAWLALVGGVLAAAVMVLSGDAGVGVASKLAKWVAFHIEHM